MASVKASSNPPQGTVRTTDLRERLRDRSPSLIDVRSIAAYNGWRLQGESRGGHIPGAAAFPRTWLSDLGETEIRRLLRAKGITTDRGVVLYGDRPDDAAAFVEVLAALGHRDVRIFEPGFSAWAADERLPIERLPNHERLVHPRWLRELMDGKGADARRGSDHALFHVNFDCPEEYEDSHLPGARHLDTNRLEDPANWNRRSADQLQSNLLELGITAETLVVLYGRDTAGDADQGWPGSRMGQAAAARAALILSYAGVRDVRLLDGGYDAWVGAGYLVEGGIRAPRSASDFGREIPSRRELIIDIDETRSLLTADDAVLVSVRSRREQSGDTSGYGYIEETGRIAGDVWCGGGPEEHPYRNLDNTIRAYPEVAARWHAAGVTPDKRVAFYCGTGWRASEAWFQAFLMGWPRIAVYDGGWLEWTRDPNNPVEIGRESAAPPTGSGLA
jgi:3-mercaptopyruvate sulfurtransferase SseA